MIDQLSVLCTVCARGGSKGVPGKNILPLAGKPLLHYSLDIINACEFIDQTLISSDSEAILDCAKDYGFETPYRRPAELAEDHVSRIDAIRDAVIWTEEKDKRQYDVILDLGVATPLKTSEDAKQCLEILVKEKASNVFSVTQAGKNPYFNMVERKADGRIDLVCSGKQVKARQASPEVYEMNDGINVWRREALFRERPQFHDKTSVYVMPEERSIDIDRPIDFKIAESILKHQA